MNLRDTRFLTFAEQVIFFRNVERDGDGAFGESAAGVCLSTSTPHKFRELRIITIIRRMKRGNVPIAGFAHLRKRFASPGEWFFAILQEQQVCQFAGMASVAIVEVVYRYNSMMEFRSEPVPLLVRFRSCVF